MFSINIEPCMIERPGLANSRPMSAVGQGLYILHTIGSPTRSISVNLDVQTRHSVPVTHEALASMLIRNCCPPNCHNRATLTL